MTGFFQSVYERLLKGERLMLVSVISGEGSVPRSSGAKMAVFLNGSTQGTIGGGSMEHMAITWSLEHMDSHACHIQRFDLSGKSAADAGMICGGSLKACFQPLDGNNPSDQDLIKNALAAIDSAKNAWLVTKITDDSISTSLYTQNDALPNDDWNALLPHMTRTPYFLTLTACSYYIEPISFSDTVYVFGGGHVAQETVKLLSHLNFRVAVFEDRAEFLTPDRFPNAVKLYNGDFKDFSSVINIEPDDYIVIMTRGHMSDYDVLIQALNTDAHYIGMIGSRRKRNALYSKLYANGMNQNDVKRVHSPIGLDIGAQTPAEIAVSIASELIKVRALKNA